MLSNVARPWALLVALSLLAGACSTRGLSLVVDDRLTFTAPQDRATVRLPVTVSWEIEDFAIDSPDATVTASDATAPDHGTFGVFIDRTPPPPGEGVEWFAQEDDTCRRDPGCPDDDWYASRGIRTTSLTSVTIEALSRDADSDRRERHEVTVVLLGPDGRRIGESAWTVEFAIDRSQP